MDKTTPSLTATLAEAQNRCRNLQSIYNEVTDPAEIDSIIHQMVVAERYYDRLLQQAKLQNLSNERIEMR